MNRKQKSAKKATTYNDNARWKCIDVHLMEPKQLYAFTFNPIYGPEHNGYKEKLECFSEFDKKICNLFAMKYAEVDMILEVSSSGKLHYHGYICITDIPNFFFYDIPRLRQEGCYEIDTFDDYWPDTYLIKQKGIMEKWSKTKGLHYRINTIGNSRSDYIRAAKIDEIKITTDMFDDITDDEMT